MPGQEFLNKLQSFHLTRAVAFDEMLERIQRGDRLSPHCFQQRGDIWELRKGKTRLYLFKHADAWYVCCGDVNAKSSSSTQTNSFKRARKMRADIAKGSASDV